MSQSALKSHIAVLREHRERLEKISVVNLFEADPERFVSLSVEDDDFLFDYSKNRIDRQSMKSLVSLARDAGVADAREKMFTGFRINFTENRAALHTALRAGENPPVYVDGVNVKSAIAQSKKRLFDFSEKVRSGEYQVAGGAVSDVVNIGIGGSNLGPAMCVMALAPFHSGPKVHFVANIDSADFYDATKDLNPETTLFIIASKSFSTAETMVNAKLARDWLAERIPEESMGRHLVTISNNMEAVSKFGIDRERMFELDDWVGGRYSIWSAIGLPLMIAIGSQDYQHFLDGGRVADEHFLNREFENNIPVLMALIGIWHRNIWNFPAQAILPYDNRLSQFPAYLQQLDMESNGKCVCNDGSVTEFSTGPVIWGEPGTNGQHSFYQLLYQGTDIVPCDFLIAARSCGEDQSHQKILAANCFAQSLAMMSKQSYEEVVSQLKNEGLPSEQITQLAPHKVFAGNRPSSTILYRELSPFALGRLIAFYEHKIFVQGVIWGINSFDQWGVELGKSTGDRVFIQMSAQAREQSEKCFDASTNQLIKRFLTLTE